MLGHKKWFQKIGARLGWDPRPERWIFIVGCYNSGTTLLQQILASHTRIGTLPGEGVFFTDLLPYPEQYGWTRMWHRCLDEMKRDMVVESPTELAERVKRQWSIWFPDDTPYLLEKSIANTTRMLFLNQQFSPAYFVHIVRNGYAVAEGIRRKANLERWPNKEYEGRYPIDLCANQWNESLRIVRECRSEVDHFYEIQYEELTEEPEATVQSIADFLGIRESSEFSTDEEWNIHEKTNEIKNMNGRSINRLSANDIEQIKSIAWRNLSEYGYQS